MEVSLPLLLLLVLFLHLGKDGPGVLKPLYMVGGLKKLLWVSQIGVNFGVTAPLGLDHLRGCVGALLSPFGLGRFRARALSIIGNMVIALIVLSIKLGLEDILKTTNLVAQSTVIATLLIARYVIRVVGFVGMHWSGHGDRPRHTVSNCMECVQAFYIHALHERYRSVSTVDSPWVRGTADIYWIYTSSMTSKNAQVVLSLYIIIRTLVARVTAIQHKLLGIIMLFRFLTLFRVVSLTLLVREHRSIKRKEEALLGGGVSMAMFLVSLVTAWLLRELVVARQGGCRGEGGQG